MINKKLAILLAILAFGLTTFGTYKYFSSSVSIGGPKDYQAPTADGTTSTDTNGPLTEACPMNGQMYSAAQKAKWEKRRPLGIMVQNNIEARPQSGLSSADVIYEAVAEGGITRFLTMYYCDETKIVGSVRSARIYFIRLLQAYGDKPLYGHVGGANTPGPADALGEIRKLGWAGVNDLDQFRTPFPQYWRDYDRLPNRATEHTVYTNPLKLWEFAKKTNKLSNVDEKGTAWNTNFKPWTFKNEGKSDARGDVKEIAYGFWSNNLGSDYTVQWNFDKEANVYKRVNGGEPHIDKNTDKQLEAKNVVVVFAEESVANDGYEHGQHMLYDIIGDGDALVFQDGKSIKATWKKPKETEMMRFYENGKEISFVRGKIWVSVIPTGNKVSYGQTAKQDEVQKAPTKKHQKSTGTTE